MLRNTGTPLLTNMRIVVMVNLNIQIRISFIDVKSFFDFERESWLIGVDDFKAEVTLVFYR